MLQTKIARGRVICTKVDHCVSLVFDSVNSLGSPCVPVDMYVLHSRMFAYFFLGDPNSCISVYPPEKLPNTYVPYYIPYLLST